MRRAKIVCTLGPATDSYEQIAELVDAGMDVARLNLGYGTRTEHQQRIDRVREAAGEYSSGIGILADLQGPKIRLGTFRDGPVLLEAGDHFTLAADANTPGDQYGCSTTYSGLVNDVTPGDSLLVDDGRLVLRVTRTDGSRIHTTVTHGGMVSDHKGLTLPGVPVSVSALSTKDAEDLRWALRCGVDLVALSFVRNGDDIKEVHRVMAEEGRFLPVIAKIEKPQAEANLQSIVDAFDGIMVARGHLGIETPLQDVPHVQKRAVRLAKRNAKPVIVATQMLDSMVSSTRPTRAEVSDVANAILDGTDAVMLSGETSIGAHPAATVRTMGRIVAAAEKTMLGGGLPQLTDATKPHTQAGAVARAAAEIGDFLDASLLVAFTQSGDTVRRLSRYRSPIPVMAFTPDQRTCNQLSLTWGVEAHVAPMVETTDAMVELLDGRLRRMARCGKGETVVMTAGSPPGVPGTTNLVRVHRVGER